MGDGFFPDGFAFDEEGGLWVTSLVSNRLVRFHDDRIETVLEDANTDFIDRVEQAFASCTMAAEHLGNSRNVAAATHQRGIRGAGRRTVYFGSLHGSCLYRFRTTVTGAVPPHWCESHGLVR